MLSLARNAFATAPTATRATVLRALARSDTGGISSSPYFIMPAKSAWPGRGTAPSAPPGLPLTVRARLGRWMPMGAPVVRPFHTPPTSVTVSRSIFWRLLRPYALRRRARSCWITRASSGRPAGIPSTIASSASPCESPAVRKRMPI